MSLPFLERAMKSRFLQFSVGIHDYCVPLILVREVVPAPTLNPIPLMPRHFAGMGRFRDHHIPVLDLRLKLAADRFRPTEHTVILCNLEEMAIGLLVDSAHSVFAPSPDQFINSRQHPSMANPEFVEGIFQLREKRVMVINPERLLTHEERATATAARKSAA